MFRSELGCCNACDGYTSPIRTVMKVSAQRLLGVRYFMSAFAVLIEL